LLADFDGSSFAWRFLLADFDGSSFA
jgi:hypothetical protein